MSQVTHAITVMAPSPELPDLQPLKTLLEQAGAQIHDMRSVAVPRALQGVRSVATLLISGVGDHGGLKASLEALAPFLGADCVLQTMATRLADYKLAVFDMDSTLIQCEVIDELAKAHGVGEKVSEITERAMRGELDFNGSFTERLGMLNGLGEAALAEIAANLPITPGMPELIATLRGRGIKTAILSGGFNYFAQALQDRFGFDEFHANTLEIVDGKATGRVVNEIVNGDMKAGFLKSIAAEMGIEQHQVIAAGDGANDLPMLALAGLGVAYCAKPVVREAAAHNITQIGLDGVLYLMGSNSELV